MCFYHIIAATISSYHHITLLLTQTCVDLVPDKLQLTDPGCGL
jgi:hypothetical protein